MRLDEYDKIQDGKKLCKGLTLSPRAGLCLDEAANPTSRPMLILGARRLRELGRNRLSQLPKQLVLWKKWVSRYCACRGAVSGRWLARRDPWHDEIVHWIRLADLSS